MIYNILSSYLNRNKFLKHKLSSFGHPNNISIDFRLSIPQFVNDEQLLTKDNSLVIVYSKLKKQSKSFIVRYVTSQVPYPAVGKNKYLIKTKIYADEILKQDNIVTFLQKEHNDIFLDFQSNLLLDKINNLTTEWNNLTSNIRVPKTPSFNYAKTKYDRDTDAKFYNEEGVFPF